MSLTHSERESYLRRHIVEIAEEQFPDDVDLDWPILAIEHRGDWTAATVEPGGDVGYPRFVFLVSFSGDSPEHMATYAQERGVFSLLSYTPGVNLDEIPRQWR